MWCGMIGKGSLQDLVGGEGRLRGGTYMGFHLGIILYNADCPKVAKKRSFVAWGCGREIVKDTSKVLGWWMCSQCGSGEGHVDVHICQLIQFSLLCIRYTPGH